MHPLTQKTIEKIAQMTGGVSYNPAVLAAQFASALVEPAPTLESWIAQIRANQNPGENPDMWQAILLAELASQNAATASSTTARPNSLSLAPSPGMPPSPSVWLVTDSGAEYSAVSGTWTAKAGPNAVQATSGKRPAAITTVAALAGRYAVPFGSAKHLAPETPPLWRHLHFVATRTSSAGSGLLAASDLAVGALSMANPGLLIQSAHTGGPANVGGPRWSFGSSAYDPLASHWLNRPHVYGFEWRLITTDTQLEALDDIRVFLTTWVDGQRHAISFTVDAATDLPDSLALEQLGTTPQLIGSDSSYYWDGSTSEVVGWDEDHASSAVWATQRSLLQKYGIAEPAQNPQLLIEGDSQSSGSNGPTWVNSLWAKRSAADTQYDPIGKIMVAVGGRNAQIARANVGLYTPMVLPGQWVSVLIGTNDLDNGRSVGDILEDTRHICTAYGRVGARVALGTMLPRIGASANWTEAKRLELNARWRADWPQYAAALVDYAADSRFSEHTETYFVDGVHENQAGADAMADIFLSSVPL